MKKITILTLFALLIISCKEEDVAPTKNPIVENPDTTKAPCPRGMYGDSCDKWFVDTMDGYYEIVVQGKVIKKVKWVMVSFFQLKST